MNRWFESAHMRRFRVFALLFVWSSWLVPVAAQASFLEPEQAFKMKVDEIRGSAVAVRWTIAPGYYLYRDRITVEAVPGERIGQVSRPRGESKEDPNFGRVEVYHDSVRVQVDAADATALRLGWQGCSEDGLCYPPQHQTVTIAAATVAPAPRPAAPAFDAATPLPAGARATEPAPALPSSNAWTDSGIRSVLQERPLLWTVPLFLVLGIALAFTPCVLPMVPIVSGMVVGNRVGPERAFALSLAFVVAMALVYAALGVLAAVAGAGLQAWMQNPWALGAFAAMFAVLAFAMFGFYELQLPGFLRDRLAATGGRGGSIASAASMGVLSALLVGPCMTAPLAGTLLYIAQSGEVLEGALLLWALGVGMGLPLILVSTFGARWLPRPGPWMDRVRSAVGFLLLATALWMLQRVLPAPLMLFLWGALLTGAAVALWHGAAAAHQGPASSGARVLVRGGAMVAALWGGAMVLGAAAGATDPARPLAAVALAQAGQARGASAAQFETIADPAVLQARLEQARSEGRPALVEFSAEWCSSCKTIERKVFGDPSVVRRLEGVMLLRADITASDTTQREWMRRHQVVGPPTVMLFDAQGIERRADRLVGEFASGDLLQRTVRTGAGT